MFDTYEKARSDAQTKANASGRSYGIERVTMLGKGWRVFMLPNPENRRGLRPRDVRPVRVVPGTAAPTVVGHHGHHETPGGAFVRYPGAYRKAFGRPVPTTREVVVGAQWRPAVGGVE